MTKTQIERHAELVNRAHFSTKLEHKAMWLNMAKDFRKGTLVVVKTRSCDWFSNRVKELKSVSKAKQIKSLMEDSGYSKAEATKLVNAGF